MEQKNKEESMKIVVRVPKSFKEQINTYTVGEMLKRILGDEFHEDFLVILKSAREKANYYVSRKLEDISKEQLADFFSIGKDYRNE